MRNFLLFTLFCFTASPLTAQDRKGQISGRIVDAVSQEPLVGANVVVVERPTIGSTTDTSGAFFIPFIEVGEYSLRMTLLGYEPVVSTNIVVSTGRSAKLRVKMRETTVQAEGVEVRADYFDKAGSISPLSTIGLNAAEIRRSPGANQDMQRIVQTLPGVSNTTDQTNELIVRGGAPNENLTVMDYIEIPSTNHYPNQYNSGGPINMVNVDLIDDIQFSTGGFPAQYGDKLSSVMNVTMREGDRRRMLAGSGFAHFAGVGGVFEGGFADGRGSWIVSARQSFLETLDKIIGISSIGLTAIPKYWDAQWKAVYDLSGSDKLQFTGIYGSDKILFSGEPQEEVLSKAGMTDSTGIERVDFSSRQYAAGVTWKKLWGESGFSALTLSTLGNVYDVDVSRSFTQRTYGPTGKLLTSSVLNRSLVYRNQADESTVGLKYELVYQINHSHELAFGAQYQTVRQFDDRVFVERDTARFDINGDGTFETGPILSPGANSSTLLKFGDSYKAFAYASDKFRLLPQLTATAGVRYDYFQYSGRGNVSPRVSLSYELFPAVTKLNFAYGEFYQTQSYPLYGDGFDTGINRSLLNSHARHFVAGIEHIFDEGMKGSFEVYSKTYSDLPVSEEYVHAGDPTFRSQRQLNVGTRTSTGIEIFLQQKQVLDLYYTLGYSYSRTLDDDPRSGHAGETYRSSYDHPHIFTFVVGKVVKDVRHDADQLPLILRIPTYLVPLSDDMEISLKFRYQSGNVYTPMKYVTTEQHRIGGMSWSRGWWVDGGTVNSARYPDYHRLDLQWISRYHLSNFNIEVVFLLENVYNRANVFQTNYNTDGTTETAYQFSFFPVAGIQFEF